MTAREAGGAAAGASRGAPRSDPQLVRGLSTTDGVLLTIGSVVGTGIFLSAGDVARALPHDGLILSAWLLGGLLTVAGALTYAELGVLFPRAGGLYQYLKEAYGPLPGFLYGWACFGVIMAGGIAAIAVGFGEYLGVFVPFFSGGHTLWSLSLGGLTWTVDGAQLAAVLAIGLLTAVNGAGLTAGKTVQNLLTVLRLGAIAAFVGTGFLVPARDPLALTAPLSAGGTGSGLAAALGVAMIAVLWTYDGWYGLTFEAGEMKDPARGLPRGLVGGAVAVVALYAVINLVYARALSPAAMGDTRRIGETAAAALFGDGGSWLLAGAIAVASFGCLSATILYSARIYQPMAAEGLFFRRLARVHPRYRTPAASLWAQGLWASVLALSGTYTQLYTYVTFAVVLFQTATGAAVFVLRRRHPHLPRPYRTWGYPAVPALFVAASLALLGNTLWAAPRESLFGLGLLALGLPAYWTWSRRR